MRAFLTVLLIAAFTVSTLGQDEKKILAESVRNSEKIVKGAPFSAEAIAESIQMLTDGNRITRRTVSRLYRDNEGRFRREDMPKQLGVPGAVVEMPESIVITDPVAGIRYWLNPKDQTFRQSPIKEEFDFKLKSEDFWRKAEETKVRSEELRLKIEAAKVEQQVLKQESKAREKETQVVRKEMAEQEERLQDRKMQIAKRIAEDKGNIQGGNDGSIVKPNSDPNARTESLGVQNIEGIQAEGERTTTIIPAQTIGNDLPIEVVYEKWYSPELQLIVLSKHSDPRLGIQTYRLTNISREEPPGSIFSPPADYKLANDNARKPHQPLEPRVPLSGVKPVLPKPPVPPKPRPVDQK